MFSMFLACLLDCFVIIILTINLRFLACSALKVLSDMASKRRSDEGGEEQIAMDKSTAFTTSMEELMRGVQSELRSMGDRFESELNGFNGRFEGIESDLKYLKKSVEVLKGDVVNDSTVNEKGGENSGDQTTKDLGDEPDGGLMGAQVGSGKSFQSQKHDFYKKKGYDILSNIGSAKIPYQESNIVGNKIRSMLPQIPESSDNPEHHQRYMTVFTLACCNNGLEEIVSESEEEWQTKAKEMTHTEVLIQNKTITGLLSSSNLKGLALDAFQAAIRSDSSDGRGHYLAVKDSHLKPTIRMSKREADLQLERVR